MVNHTQTIRRGITKANDMKNTPLKYFELKTQERQNKRILWEIME